MSTEPAPTIAAPEQPKSALLEIVEQHHLPAQEALTIRSSFVTFMDEIEAWKTKIASYTHPEIASAARRAIKKLRCDSEKERERLKSVTLNVGRAIDGVAAKIWDDAQVMEKRLESIEKAAEIAEAKRKAEIKAVRETELTAIGVDCRFFQLGDMPDDAYQSLLESSQAAHKLKLETAAKKAEEARLAKEQAEQERIAKEQAAAAEAERQRLEIERLKKEAAEREAAAKAEQERLAKEKAEQEKAAAELLKKRTATHVQRVAELQLLLTDAEYESIPALYYADMDEKQFALIVTSCKARLEQRIAAEKLRREQEESERLVRLENERLAKEISEKAAMLKAEEEKRKQEERTRQVEAERIAHEKAVAAKAAFEQAVKEKAEADAKIAAEQKARELAEAKLAEAAKIAADAEAAEIEAAKKAAAAPDREKIMAFAAAIRGIPLPICTTNAGFTATAKIAEQKGKMVKWLEGVAATL